jgi:hypothetical protein
VLSCGFANQESMNFCGRCGTKLANTCPSCGFTNPSDHAFCGKCGTPLTGQTPAPSPSTLEPPAPPTTEPERVPLSLSTP